MTHVLGIKPTMSHSISRWGGHHAGACLVSDDGIVAAVEEERFSRVKYGPKPSFPEESIRYVLSAGGVSIDEIDVIAIGRNHQKYIQTLKNNPTSLIPTSVKSGYQALDDILCAFGTYIGLPREQIVQRIDQLFEENFNGQWCEIAHHRCHAASAVYCSDFDDEICLTIDGSGETDSTVLWDTNLNRVDEFSQQNSIGRFYAGGCHYLGFRGWKDAGKVMGLASYGEYRKEFADAFDEIVDIRTGNYDVSTVQNRNYEKLVEHFGPERHYPAELTQRHKDVAYHLQAKTEEVVKELVCHHINESGVKKVSLAGGVAMNCKLNREVMNMDCVENLFVQPAANDSGICLGAALEGYRLETGSVPNPSFDHVYYGPEYSNDEIESEIENAKVSYDQVEDICAQVASLLSDGELVGWYQGRMEFGARALGNRSIIASPTSQASLDRVNKYVKNRESWRPFAPSILDDARNEYLRHGDEAPYMILLDHVKKSKRHEVPAITHVDGTTRPQTVSKSSNPKYYELIQDFEEITGVPVLLNTSFNVAGEPIVESPKQAIADFYTTGLTP